jgi:leader peptidase (prepilin peptidase) / N-methyltransferase
MVLETDLSPFALALAALPFGLIVGSFLNVVILRLPVQLKNGWRRESEGFLGLPSQAQEPVTIAKPASRCPSCGAAIKPWHNIPVISYIFLGGKCSCCSQTISLQYPMVELLAGVATMFIVYQFGLTAVTAYSLLFTYALIALTGIDFHEQLLPDQKSPCPCCGWACLPISAVPLCR